MPAKSLPQPAADPPPIILRFKERLVTLACPAPYDDETVTLWANPPDRLVRETLAALPRDPLALSRLLAHDIIKQWSFHLTDGRPAPISLAALDAVPADLASWLVAEWLQVRQAPLAAPPSPPKPAATPPTAP